MPKPNATPRRKEPTGPTSPPRPTPEVLPPPAHVPRSSVRPVVPRQCCHRRSALPATRRDIRRCRGSGTGSTSGRIRQRFQSLAHSGGMKASHSTCPRCLCNRDRPKMRGGLARNAGCCHPAPRALPFTTRYLGQAMPNTASSEQLVTSGRSRSSSPRRHGGSAWRHGLHRCQAIVAR